MKRTSLWEIRLRVATVMGMVRANVKRVFCCWVVEFRVFRRSDCHMPIAAKGRAVVSSSGRPSVK